MRIRRLISGIFMAALVTAGLAAPDMAQARESKHSANGGGHNSQAYRPHPDQRHGYGHGGHGRHHYRHRRHDGHGHHGYHIAHGFPAHLVPPYLGGVTFVFRHNRYGH